MDAKVTLSFDQQVIEKAKEFAQKNNISLSRLCEFLLRKATETNTYNLENLPISNWVNLVAEGQAEYKTRSRQKTKKEFRER